MRIRKVVARYAPSDKCTEMRIRLNMVDSQHDKRYVGRAEALMRYIEERAKVLMLDTRLAIEEWEMAVDYAIRQHNHMPALPHKRTIKSRGAALGDSMPRGAEQRGSGAPEIARERGGARPPSVFFSTTTQASPWPGPLRGH